MFKIRLFGYSKKKVDMLLKQIENDYLSEKMILENKVKALEEECMQLKHDNEENKTKLNKAKYIDLLKIDEHKSTEEKLK